MSMVDVPMTREELGSIRDANLRHRLIRRAQDRMRSTRAIHAATLAGDTSPAQDQVQGEAVWHQAMAALDRECARLEASAQRWYGYRADYIRAGFRPRSV